MKFIWNEVPRGVRKEVEPFVKRFGCLLPGWVEHCRIIFGPPPDEMPNAVASTSISVEYRHMAIAIHPAYLTLDERQMATTILHEFIHAPLTQPNDVFWNLLDSTTSEDSPMYEWAKGEHCRAMESCVSDLEYGIARLLGLPEPDLNPNRGR